MVCTRCCFCAPGMRLTIIPDSSVQAMNPGDGDEVIYTSLIHIDHLLSFTGLCRC